MRYYLKEVGVEKEATPGTAETIVEADLLVRVQNSSAMPPQQEMIETEESQSVGSKRALIAGQGSQSFTLSYLLRGSGALATAPACADLFEMAGLSGASAKTIAIGAITSGPYLAGEIITGGTSSATGLVLQQTATGAASVPYLPISSTLQSGETLTGGDSGATSTSSGAPTDGGYAWRPNDWSEPDGSAHHATVRGLMDGMYFEGRGCLSTLSLESTASNITTVTQEVTGAYSAHGDAALYGTTAFPEDSVAFPLMGAQTIKIGSYNPIGVESITLNISPDVQLKTDVTSTGGVRYADFMSARPEAVLSFDQVLAATDNTFATWRAGTEFLFEYSIGSATGNTFVISIPNAQFQTVGMSEGPAGVAELPVTIVGNGQRNEDVLIWMK